MARLDSTQFKQLQAALLDAYSSREDLEQMVRLELGVNLDEVAGGTNLRAQVFALVSWAERFERVRDLVNGALTYNPGNVELQQLASISFQPPLSPVVPVRGIENIFSAVLHDIPFIGPVPFSSETADLFFGRDVEIERLAARLLTRGVPLIVVNGLSGSGKTSLLRAGLIPRLEKQGVRTVYASILDSPHSDLLYALRRASACEDEHNSDTIHLLNQVAESAGKSWTVLIVDQLERCFNTSPLKEEQHEFWRDIGRILRGDATYPVKLILCVRSDWLHAFQTVSPSPVDLPVFNYLFLVEPLTEKQAHEAIIAPFRKFHVSIEDQVIAEIVSDLSTPDGYVYPPQLQVVGSTLYEYLENQRIPGKELHLSHSDYASLHGASSILRQHLVSILRSLGPHENVGWQVLLRLVGDDDIRVSRHEEDLYGNFSKEVFQPVIACLTEYALVVRDISKVDGRHVYTLTHDYLISELKARFEHDHRLQALKTSEHYLESGLADNRRATSRGEGFLPLEHERYNYIWRNRDGIDWVSADAAEFLTLSALWHGDKSFVDWLLMLPNDCRQQTALRMQAICQQQLQRGDRRPIQAIEDAAKQNVPADIADILVSLLRQSFSTSVQEDGSSFNNTEVFAGALWSLRRYLTPTELAGILPALLRLWLRNHRVAVLSAVGSLLMFAAVLSAAWYIQENLAGAWIAIAPLRAGVIDSFAVAPDSESKLIAATSRGRTIGEASTIYEGDASDRQWVSLGSTLVNEPIQALATAKAGRDTTVFAAVNGRGIYRWRGEANGWELINQGLNSYNIVDIAVDPTNSLIVYAAAANYSGVFESHDGGDSWFDASGNALFGVSISRFAFSNQGPGWILAGTADGRIFRKQRNLKEWEQVAAFPGSGEITAFTWDLLEGETLLAGTSTGLIYISVNGGLNWSLLSSPPNTFAVTSIVIMPDNPEKVFLTAFGVGGYTIWRSIDDVYTWELVESADFSREHMRLTVGPSGLNQLLAYGAAGLFVTEDQGASWLWVRNLDAPIAAIKQVVTSPLRGGPTYILLEGSVFVASDLQDVTWERSSGLPALVVRDLVADPAQQNIAYAGIYIPNRWSFYKTEDMGRTWQATPKPAIAERWLDDTTAIAIGVQADESLIYLGTASCGVLHSLDGGQSWETYGRTDCIIQNAPYAVSDIVVDPRSIDTVYVAADNATVYRSNNRGRTWLASTLPISGRINGLVADQQIDGRLYAIAGGDGFWRSDDGGSTWRKLESSLKERSLVSIAGARSANTLYVAATNGDVWMTSDGGESWRSIRRNLAASNITSIALTGSDEIPIVSTDSEGMYLLRRGF